MSSRAVLIFGGSGGIGERIASRLLSSGKSVHLVGRNAEKLKIASEKLSKQNEKSVKYTVCDVMNTNSIGEAVEKAVKETGPLHGLVYAIGSINLKPLKNSRPSDFLDAFNLNVIGAVEAIRHVEPHFAVSSEKKNTSVSVPGSIVLFSTVAALRGFANHSPIAAAKGAINGLTLSLASEFSPLIRVNAVAPSLVKTNLAQGLISTEVMQKAIAQAHPLKRLGEPEDAAELACFLLSENAGWITGQIFSVDGGRSTLS